MTGVSGVGVIACVGEPLVCFAATPGSSVLDCLLAEVSEGGAELNVAVHLARLRLPVRFVGAVGDDVLGRRIEARLRREGVDTRALHREAGGRTGAYVKDWSPAGRSVAYLRTGSAAARMAPGPDAFAGVGHVHTTGITAALSRECADLLQRLLARPRPHTVSFDVNYRERLWPAEVAGPRLASLARLADVVLVGRDEAELLWGTANADEIRAFLPEPPELVVKDDARAATVFAGSHRAVAIPPPAEVTEPVGAGDAFAAGYLYGRRVGRPPGVALAAGHRLARAALQASDDLGAPVARCEVEAAMQT